MSLSNRRRWPRNAGPPPQTAPAWWARARRPRPKVANQLELGEVIDHGEDDNVVELIDTSESVGRDDDAA